MPTLKISPSGETFEIYSDKSLLDILREKDVYIKSTCGGHASCRDCVVKLISGGDTTNPPTEDEAKLLGNVFHITKERLACQMKVLGDLEVDLSMHDKGADQEKIKKRDASFIKRRSKKEVGEIQSEREKMKEERRAADGEWHKHWERDAKDGGRKKMDGGKRPMPFNYEPSERASGPFDPKAEPVEDSRPSRSDKPRFDKPKSDKPKYDKPREDDKKKKSFFDDKSFKKKK